MMRDMGDDDKMFEIDGPARTEIDNSSDRVAAIVGGAYVQEALVIGLRHYLIADKNVFARLFEKSGPLSTFEAQINLAYLCSFISKELRDDLIIIKKVRNDFAHRLDTASFEDQQNRDLIGNLTYLTVGSRFIEIAENRAATARERFVSACGEVAPQLTERRLSRLPEPIGRSPGAPLPSLGKSR